jgi:hypothetical protein
MPTTSGKTAGLSLVKKKPVGGALITSQFIVKIAITVFSLGHGVRM